MLQQVAADLELPHLLEALAKPTPEHLEAKIEELNKLVPRKRYEIYLYTQILEEFNQRGKSRYKRK